MSDLKPPKDASGDWIHATIKGSLGAIPLAGGLASEFFGMIVAPPIAIRRNEWMEDVAQSIKTLEGKGLLSAKDLSANEQFVDAVFQSTHAAMRTSSTLKRDALRNAVLNVALRQAPEFAYQQMFLEFVERFTDWHILLLELYQDPRGWQQKHNIKFPELMMGGLAHIIEHAFPELASKREFYRQVSKDLFSAGLINTESTGGTMTWDGILSKRTTDFGDSFLKFIATPVE
jgi:hypothetical protein